MAEPLPSFQPAAEAADEDPVSAVSPSSWRSRVSPVKDFSPSSLFRRNGYHRMPSDGVQEMVNLDGHQKHQKPRDLPTSPPRSHFSPDLGDLGIVNAPSVSRSSIRRVPVGSKQSPPDTPRSHHGLLGSASNSAASTPMMGSFSKRSTAMRPGHIRNQSSWGDQSTIFERNMSPSEDTDAPPKKLLDPPATNPGDDISDGEFDDEKFYKGFGEPPSYCGSKEDIHANRTSWLSITVFLLSIYSTVMSGIWLITAIVQPRWGHAISSRYGLDPSTATTLSALVSKTIEMSFVTVFISCLGQVLTRRALVRNTVGMTLGEMTMRNWVIQPGSLITHAESVPSAGMTILGALTLTATVAATFYTTASDSMIAPKLKNGSWEAKELSGHIRASYANAQYVEAACPSLLDDEDPDYAAESCMNVRFSGQSYRNLMNFMTVWDSINENGTSVLDNLADRPAGTTLLFDNTTMEASWIETHASDVAATFDKYSRIVNNVTMAMPHPGVYAAATTEVNGILQPDDLAGVGEYSIRAGVVSPAINVMCVNMDAEDLEPLVYTEWSGSKVDKTGVGDQVIGYDGWEEDVPKPVDGDGDDDFLNRTSVDEIFRWGPDYSRRPPVFPMYPADYNLITNSSVYMSDSIYIVGKNGAFDSYTLCELKSWLSPNCSTRFEISGTAGADMTSHCEDPHDEDRYLRSFPPDQEWAVPVMDWKVGQTWLGCLDHDFGKANNGQWLADSWRLSMDLNGGVYNNNASNARILTQLALESPVLPPSLPSLAEALAVYASSTLVAGALDTPFRHYWDWDENALGAPGPLQAFNASVRTQQYTSGHVSGWQSIFYIVLILVFAINIFCLAYFILRSGLVTDFTEPQNLFALAINSPPSAQLKGSCGGGPAKRDLVVPWRVAYAPSANHYFFDEASARPWKGKYAEETVITARESGQATASSYKRLSSGNRWI